MKTCQTSFNTQQIKFWRISRAFVSILALRGATFQTSAPNDGNGMTMVFRLSCKTDCKKINWAEQIAMERRKISHEFEGATRKQRNALVTGNCHPNPNPGETWGIRQLGRVVRKPVSASPGLNFNPGFFIFLSKAFSRIIFSFLFRVSNHQIVGKEN